MKCFWSFRTAEFRDDGTSKSETAHEAALARIERIDFRFPEFDAWLSMNRADRRTTAVSGG
jgi:hypothetical protein